MENSGNSQGILCNLRENCNKQSIFSLSFKYLCKTAVDWVNKIIRNRDEVTVRWWPVILLELMWNDPWWRSLLHLLFVAITCGKVSLWLWKSLENSGNFFLLLCGHPGWGCLCNVSIFCKQDIPTDYLLYCDTPFSSFIHAIFCHLFFCQMHSQSLVISLWGATSWVTEAVRLYRFPGSPDFHDTSLTKTAISHSISHSVRTHLYRYSNVCYKRIRGACWTETRLSAHVYCRQCQTVRFLK